MKQPFRQIGVVRGAVRGASFKRLYLFDSSVERTLHTATAAQRVYRSWRGRSTIFYPPAWSTRRPPAAATSVPVQMADLDNDGTEEAIAFFRKPADEKPLKVYIFKAEEDGYHPLCVIESSGTAINSIYYRDLNGDGRMEVVVGWKISSDVQAVAVYNVSPQPEQLMRSTYSRYTMMDVDQDNAMELVVFRTDSEGSGVAECYGWNRTPFPSNTAASCR